MHGCLNNRNMDQESISFCSSCKSILQYSSSIGEPYTLNEKNNIERSIENDEIGLNITEKQNKKREGEDFVEKLMFYTNKKIKHLASYDTYKNITRIMCAEYENNDFSNETYPVKISHAQDIQQRNNCKTEKANNSIRNEEKNAEMINNGSQSTAPNILNYRKNILQIARSVLELSNYIDNMRKLILQEINKRQSRVLSDNENKGVKLDL